MRLALELLFFDCYGQELPLPLSAVRAVLVCEHGLFNVRWYAYGPVKSLRGARRFNLPQIRRMGSRWLSTCGRVHY